MSTKHSSCTAILVGKKASLDGSTMIARNEDGYGPINPKKFVVHAARASKGEVFTSPETGMVVPLPAHAYRYTAEPNYRPNDGFYEEAGINEKNVAMSATETTFTNPRVLGFDPLVLNGLNEEAMTTLVLPYIDSARAGVQRLGDLIEKYGTGESNGIAFSDHDEVWYMETAGGHHWIAQRIPDDAYAIAPNQINIQEIDFDQPEQFMWSTDLAKFVADHHLNAHPGHFNYRQIFGTHTESDAHYNTPRAWYGQRLFTPSVEQEPTSQEIPFIQHADRKLAVEDLQYFLSSHYQETPYDPFGKGTKEQKTTFRSIALDRNQVSHILQIRNHVAPEYAGIQWIAMGFFAYSPYVPFFTNINDTPENYRNTTKAVDLDNAYWLYKSLGVLVEPHYHDFVEQINEYRDACQAQVRNAVELTDQQAAELSGAKLTDYLTQQNELAAAKITKNTKLLMDSLVKQSLNLSPITFEPGDNL
ncbi:MULTISPECIES: C69 family dipeptidase [Loigolactobacillus]|uniref:Dipeptidase n=1 Tax=Loigolactobacillus backii TaxID=375175 RepID=A0A192H0K3_9LACO|nr:MULTISPECIES: C69 family dipeptidase [Loigolactobacillus]ANK58847.1 peptidase C69 [Loigolactobacillus backii]ANK61491.1 peptidase C69 [Loigolactobacillus backii]ANK63837.1 peptidase C69 [Loigolactobacillus backii]ANK66285.1 peptidase C69 [Loigolactobacillus backii]ANK69310.1 peptidase C69 [Loigolactobacillus backii]